VYLHAPLEDEIYIKPPQIVMVPSAKILHLQKNLYRQKQAAHSGGKTLAAMLGQRGFCTSVADPALYINHTGNEYLGVHVDDLLCVGKEANGFTCWLGAQFTVISGLFVFNENTIGPVVDLLVLVIREASVDRK